MIAANIWVQAEFAIFIYLGAENPALAKMGSVIAGKAPPFPYVWGHR